MSASAAVDGKSNTRWSSAFKDPQSLQVDLGRPTAIKKIVLNWERAYATAFQIQTSDGGGQWKTIHTTTAGKGGVQTVNVSATGRYVRLYATKRSGQYGVSLWEFQVFGNGLANPQPSVTPTKPTPSSSPSSTPTKPAPSTTPTKPVPSDTPTTPAPGTSSSKKGWACGR
ncbi:discoidin domain-containing protein [Streptosporangium lutulentum]